MVPLRAGSREQHGLPHGVGRAGPHKPDPTPQPQVRASGISVGLGMEMGTGMDKARPGQAMCLWLRDRACLSSSHGQAMQGCNPAQPQLGQGLRTRAVGYSNSPGPEVSPRQGLPMVLPAGSPHSHPRNGAQEKEPLLASLVLNWSPVLALRSLSSLKTHGLGFVKKASNFPA